MYVCVISCVFTVNCTLCSPLSGKNGFCRLIGGQIYKSNQVNVFNNTALIDDIV